MLLYAEQIKGCKHCDTEWILRQIAGYSRVDKLVSLLITLTGPWSSEIGFIFVILYKISVSQLIVTIILIINKFGKFNSNLNFS